jgi:hypothetical protein
MPEGVPREQALNPISRINNPAKSSIAFLICKSLLEL